MFDYFDNKLNLGKDFSVSDFSMLHEKMASKKLDFVVVSKSHATDDQFMANVYFMFPKTPILVSKTHFEMDDSVFLSQKEMQNFSRIVNSAAMHRCKMNIVDLDTDFEVYSPTSVVASSLKFESIIQKINKAKVMGSSLSQFEKYLYAYQQVTGFGVDLKYKVCFMVWKQKN